MAPGATETEVMAESEDRERERSRSNAWLWLMATAMAVLAVGLYFVLLSHQNTPFDPAISVPWIVLAVGFGFGEACLARRGQLFSHFAAAQLMPVFLQLGRQDVGF